MTVREQLEQTTKLHDGLELTHTVLVGIQKSFEQYQDSLEQLLQGLEHSER